MTDIDNMDMPGFLRLRAWRANGEKRKAAPQRRFIDEVWSTAAR